MLTQERQEEINNLFIKAASDGDLIMVQHYLKQGAEIEAKNIYGGTPLMCSANWGHLEVVKLLIEKKAEIEATDNIGRTPLMHAANSGNLDVVEHLIEYGAGVEAKSNIGMTPLMFAADSGNLDVVEHLIEYGANTNATAIHGKTPLMFAAAYGKLEVVKLLIKNGAEVEAQEAFYGKTPLMFAAAYGSLEVVKLLIKNGAKIGATDIHGKTPLMVAAQNGESDIAKLLLEHGATIDDATRQKIAELKDEELNAAVAFADTVDKFYNVGFKPAYVAIDISALEAKGQFAINRLNSKIKTLSIEKQRELKQTLKALAKKEGFESVAEGLLKKLEAREEEYVVKQLLQGSDLLDADKAIIKEIGVDKFSNKVQKLVSKSGLPKDLESYHEYLTANGLENSKLASDIAKVIEAVKGIEDTIVKYEIFGIPLDTGISALEIYKYLQKQDEAKEDPNKPGLSIQEQQSLANFKECYQGNQIEQKFQVLQKFYNSHLNYQKAGNYLLAKISSLLFVPEDQESSNFLSYLVVQTSNKEGIKYRKDDLKLLFKLADRILPKALKEAIKGLKELDIDFTAVDKESDIADLPSLDTDQAKKLISLAEEKEREKAEGKGKKPDDSQEFGGIDAGGGSGSDNNVSSDSEDESWHIASPASLSTLLAMRSDVSDLEDSDSWSVASAADLGSILNLFNEGSGSGDGVRGLAGKAEEEDTL